MECCERLKAVPRSAEEKKKLDGRINRLVGQLNGVKAMINEDRYCEDVLIQLSAIDKSVRSLATLILEEHIRGCITENIRSGNGDAVEEVIDLFRRFQ